MKNITREIELKEYPEISGEEIKQKIAICAKKSASIFSSIAQHLWDPRLKKSGEKCAIEKEETKFIFWVFLDLLLKTSSKSE